MTNARLFLDLYNRLEELLKAKYSDGERHYSSVILHFASQNEGKKWREELDMCREIRNMLSHHSRFQGEDIFQPSDAVCDFLRRVIDAVENPPVAMNICTPTERLFVCSENDRAIDVIRRMNKAGFSHVPMVKNKVVTGVFSAGTIFSRLSGYGETSVSDATLLSEFGDFLSVESHKTEAYRFVTPRASYYELNSLFIPEGPKKLRVAAIFVTRNGKQSGELLGMITPWDMLMSFPD